MATSDSVVQKQEVIKLDSFPEIKEKVSKAIVQFQSFEMELQSATGGLQLIKKVESEAEKKSAKSELRKASGKKTVYDTYRKKITNPLIGMQKAAIAYERDKLVPLDKEIERINKLITGFDEKKRKEQEEKLRREKQIAEEKARLQELIQVTFSTFSLRINDCTLETIPDVQKDLKEWTYGRYGEFETQARETFKPLQEQINTKRKALENEKKLAELERENQEKQKKLDESEQARIQAEQEELRRKKERQELESRLQREQAERQAELHKQQRELAEKLANVKMWNEAVKTGVDTIELVNIGSVPESCIKVEFRKSEVLRILKTGKPVPGLKVKMKNGKVL